MPGPVLTYTARCLSSECGWQVAGTVARAVDKQAESHMRTGVGHGTLVTAAPTPTIPPATPPKDTES